jgi:hypothetical protein
MSEAAPFFNRSDRPGRKETAFRLVRKGLPARLDMPRQPTPRGIVAVQAGRPTSGGYQHV